MKSNHLITSCAVALMLSVCATAFADPASLKISAPTNADEDGTVDLTVQFATGQMSINNIPIKKGSDRLDKMNAIKKALKEKQGLPATDWSANYDNGGFDFKVKSKKTIGKNPVVRFVPKNTGEKEDSITLAMAQFDSDSGTAYASAWFNGSFSTTDAAGESSLFSCGFTTDMGTYVAHVSAAELAGQTNGASICAALWTRLVSVAPAYGVSITNQGDSLQLDYDPSSTHSDAGVVFGTTSLTPGVEGEMGFVVVPEPSHLLTLSAASMFILRRRRSACVAESH